MPCLLAGLGAFFPRIALVLIWLTGYGAKAFDTILFPLAGFFLMPFTTCFYAIAINQFGDIKGFGLALVIVGVFFDLGGWGGARSGYRYRRTRHVARD